MHKERYNQFTLATLSSCKWLELVERGGRKIVSQILTVIQRKSGKRVSQGSGDDKL